MKDIKLSYRFFIAVLLLVFIILAMPSDIYAQCPMCRMAAGSNLEDGGSQGKGLNIGILMMLATPYALVVGITALWWYNKRKSKN